MTVPPAQLCQGEVDNLLVHHWFRCWYIRLGNTVCYYTTSFINWRSHTVIFVNLPYGNLNILAKMAQWGWHWLNTISSSHLGSFSTGCTARWPGWPRWPLGLADWRLRNVIKLFLKLVQYLQVAWMLDNTNKLSLMVWMITCRLMYLFLTGHHFFQGFPEIV